MAPPPPGPRTLKPPGRVCAEMGKQRRIRASASCFLCIECFVYFLYLSFATPIVLVLSIQIASEQKDMNRRALFKNLALLGVAATSADGQVRSTNEYAPAFPVRDRLDQGPFDIEQDEGWLTALFSSPSEKPVRNPGLGLVGYTWEENGPSLYVRAGKRSLEQQVEETASLPFVDVLYIRCDWRNV